MFWLITHVLARLRAEHERLQVRRRLALLAWQNRRTEVKRLRSQVRRLEEELERLRDLYWSEQEEEE